MVQSLKPIRLELVDQPPLEAWHTLRRAIPDGTSKEIARRLGVHADHVRRWRREPLSDEAPLGSGQRSILDRFCDLMDAVFLSHPTGVAFLVEHVRSHHAQLLESTEGLFNTDEWNARAHAAQLLSETVEAVNCLNLEECDEKTITELVEAHEAIELVIRKFRTRRPSLAAQGHEATEPARESGEHSPTGARAGSGGAR